MNQDQPPRTEISYNSYLRLDSLLSSQHPLTTAHDETLFIIQHQTSELWMKLIIHELNEVRTSVNKNDIQRANKILARVARIFDQLTSAWDVLRTMTPNEYTVFRDSLGHSSGFHSFQYRLIEYLLGNRDLGILQFHERNPTHYKVLDKELQTPSIYDCVIAAMYRQLKGGSSQPPPAQLRSPRQHVAEVQELWQVVYEESYKHWSLYEIAEKLVDLEDYFRRWRFNHVTTVERIIGLKQGTGGSSGVPFLRQRLDIVLFPELWRVRGEL